MKAFNLVSALALAVATAPPLYAAPQTESAELVVPSRMCGDYFLIPLEVDLDSDGQSTTLMALFDTGGSGLHIDPDAVVRSGGSPVEERKQITIRDATAGPLKFPKLRPYTRHLDHLSQPIGIEIDIFLPFRSFKKYLLTLDFPGREIRIARGRLAKPDGVEVFNARGPDRRPYLNTDIAGRNHRLLIDSGSSGSISLQQRDDLQWLSPPMPVSVAQGMEELRYYNIGRLDADIEIAGVEIKQPLVKIGANTELIGTDLMRRFAWTFDQRSRRVRIRADSRDSLHLPPKRGTGAVFIPNAAGYEIKRVLPGTPAERAGLQAGDIVVAVDGTRVLELGCELWSEEYREETTLSLLRGGQILDLQIAVVDIVP